MSVSVSMAEGCAGVKGLDMKTKGGYIVRPDRQGESKWRSKKKDETLC